MPNPNPAIVDLEKKSHTCVFVDAKLPDANELIMTYIAVGLSQNTVYVLLSGNRYYEGIKG